MGYTLRFISHVCVSFTCPPPPESTHNLGGEWGWEGSARGAHRGCGLCRVWAAVWPTQVLVGATVPGQVDHTAHWGLVPANVHDVGNGDKIVRCVSR